MNHSLHVTNLCVAERQLRFLAEAERERGTAPIRLPHPVPAAVRRSAKRALAGGAIAVTLLLAGVLAGLAAGQEGEPLLGSAVDRYLPTASALGPGWGIVHQDDPQPSPELFQEGAKAAYGGPGGARAVVFAWIVADEGVAPRAWAAANQLMEGYRSAFAPEIDAVDLLRLHAAAPDGCDAGARAAGIDPAAEFRTGLTLCAVGSDAIVLAVVSGDLGAEQGAAAADRLIGLVLGAATAEATPTS